MKYETSVAVMCFIWYYTTTQTLKEGGSMSTELHVSGTFDDACHNWYGVYHMVHTPLWYETINFYVNVCCNTVAQLKVVVHLCVSRHNDFY